MNEAPVRQAIATMLRRPRLPTQWSTARWIAATLALPILVGVVLGRAWTWALVITGFALALGAMPLFGVLGYELALACSLVGAILGLDVGAALARALRRPSGEHEAPRSRIPAIVRSTAAAIAISIALIAIPALVSAVRGLWIPTCDWSFGIVAYLAMPIATTVLAATVGHAIGLAVPARRYVGAALAQLPLIVVAALAFHRFYTAPPVFTYNAVLGYFPGNLYDENVQLTSTLAWSRLEQLLAAIAAIALVAWRFDATMWRARIRGPLRRNPIALGIAVSSLVGAIALRTRSGELGYAIDAEDVEQALGGRIETEHFVIHYARTPDIEQSIQLIANDHEFRYAQVTSRIGIASSQKIRSFYFADRAHKARWMGARDVEMAKPWRHEIYLDHRAFPHGSLRHEIAHVVAAEFGDPWFGVAAQRVAGVPVWMSPGLIEGLAVALDWPAGFERLTPHESVRVLQAMGAKPSIARLIGLQFFSVSSASGYTTAGSFLRFLLETYGPDALREVYRSGGDFATAYGKPVAALEREWLAMLETIAVPKAQIEGSKERFRVGSVFSRPCPHAVAKRREAAFEAAGAGHRERAIGLMRRVCADAPEEPRHLLSLATLLADGSPGDLGEALVLWTTLAYDEGHVTSTIRGEAFERLARAAALRGDFADVRRIVDRGRALPLDVNERRQLDALAFVLAHQGPAGDVLRNYFFAAVPGFEPADWALLATVAEPDLGFGHYLRGLQLAGGGDHAGAAAAFERGLALGLPGIAFVKNAARRLALSAFRASDRRRVEVAIAQLAAPEMSTGERLLAVDWTERLAFDAARSEHAPPP